LYRAAADTNLSFPVRSDDLVLSLLGKTLALLPPDKAEAMAEEVGQQYGLAMAAGMQGDDLAVGHKSLRAAMQAVADALTAHGFAAHTDQRNNQLRIVNNHCPFGDVAIEHPVICAVDRGMVKGMLTAIYGDTSPLTSASLPQGDTFCATTI
jgi:predicted ArsR family transcriptional regulator